MLGLRADTYNINTNGEGQYEFFADLSTRTLQTVRVGENAGKISKGIANAFVGYESGRQNNNGSFGVFVGFHAGALNQNGSYNTYVGAYSGEQNNRGDLNTFVGYQSGQLNKDGSQCTAVGAFAMRENTTGNKNVAVGNRAGERILDGDNNTIVGAEAGQDIRSGNNNTMTGYRSGRGSFRNNENTYVGAYAGYSNSEGDGNAFVGYKAGEFLTQGSYNVAVGAFALQKASTGDCNIAIGAFAGENVTGSGNVFIGTGSGTSNTSGDDNTIVGSDAGHDAAGSDNVYIGKNAAYDLTGNQNVVIGTEALRDLNSTGTVAIGYNVANATFQRGNCNIFIGVGADSFIDNTSYAIAIGPQNTRAYIHSIAVGEDVTNGGINSISLGYNIVSDADQCIILGNAIDISSVQVFNDPLNYRFPVNQTEASRLFYLTEAYTDTLFLNGTSNEIAIARIDNSNIYDTGNNKLQGITQPTPINLQDLFQYNLFYHGQALPYTYLTSNQSFLYADYLLDQNIRTTNFNKNTLSIETPGTFFMAAHSNESTREIIFNGLGIPALVNPNNTVACNLVPITTPRFSLNLSIPKRHGLYATTASNYTADFNIPTTFVPTCNLDLEPLEVTLPDVQWDPYPFLYTPPRYGSFSNDQYTLYPEAYFSSNDTLTLRTVNRFNNTYHFAKPSPEETISYNQTLKFEHASNIFLHPSRPTHITQATFHPVPYSNLPITITNNDPTRVTLTYQNTPYTTLTLPFQDLNLTLTVTDPTQQPIDGLNFTAYDFSATIPYQYSSNFQTAPLNSNIILTLPPFSLASVPIPIEDNQNTYITKRPNTGIVTLSPPTYQPTSLNQDTDDFQIAIQYTPADTTYFNITAITSNVYGALRLNKLQIPIQTTNPTTTIENTLTLTTTSYTTLFTSNIIPGPFNLITTIPITDSYDCNIGYLFSCNITDTSTFSNIQNPDPGFYPASNDLSGGSGQGRDFYIYNPYPATSSNLKFTFENPTPYDINIGSFYTSNYEITFNALALNRYFYKTRILTISETYKQACNLEVQTATQATRYIYNDTYTHFIYNCNVPSPTPPTLTSNYIPIDSTPTLTYTFSNLTTTTFLNSNLYIPAIPLQRTTVYHKDASYTVNRTATSNNLIFLQQNLGPTNVFHQSNINNEQIFLWNTQYPLPSQDIITSNVYFDGGRSLEVQYFVEKGGSSGDISTANTITFDNNSTATQFGFRVDNGNSLFLVAIEYACNVSFYRLDGVNKIPSTEFINTDGTSYPIPFPAYSNNPDIHYVNYSGGVNKTNIYSFSQNISTTYKRNQSLSYNVAPTAIPKAIHLTSNNLYFTNPTIHNSIYTLQDKTPNLLLFKDQTSLEIGTTFTQSDINSSRITIDNSNLYPETASFTVTLPDTSTQTIQVDTFSHPIFPSSNTPSSNIYITLHNTHLTSHQGPLYDFLQDPMELHIINHPSKGFLTSNTDFIPLSMITHSNLPYRYIPHEPMSLSNDSFQGYFSYCNIISPVYDFTIKNYWSRWSDIQIQNKTFFTSNLPRSQGLIDDNYEWSPVTISANLPDQRSNVTLTLLNQSIETDFIYVPYIERPYFTTSNLTIQVDSSSYTYLKQLADTLSSTANNPIFYITNPPDNRNGVILTNYRTQPTFTLSDVLEERTFYHHIGLTTSNDTVELRVGTSIYDMSSNTLTLTINVANKPVLTTNTYDYIYYATDQQGSNTYNPLDTTKLNISSGYIYAYDRSNIDLFLLEGSTYTPVTTLSASDLQANKLFYRPSSNFFQSGVNANASMSFRFTVNESTSNLLPSPLSKYPIYDTLFSQDWFSKYNTYESINTIESTLTSNQTISYTRFVNTTSNLSFFNKKCEFEFEFQPFQPPFDNATYIDFIKTFYFTFDLIDLNNSNIATVEFTHDTITLDTDTIHYQIPTPTTFDSTTWNAFSLINYDNLNNSFVSLTINETNYTQGLDLPNFSLSNLKQISINTPIYHPFNYYNLVQTSNLEPGTNVYYNFAHFNTQLRFRNFNIFLGTYDVEQVLVSGTSEKDIYNIIIGNQLDIRGLNNICLGKNFRTSGQGSVILGSDIGVQFDTSGQQIQAFNEIFNSIVISNNSFRNSKVRDVISIGNNVLNDITGNIEAFLAKKPVLVGNNIDSSKLDYHVNFQNTFLKTTVDTPQIYVGLENEHVCVGYNTNAKINNPYILHVNGGTEILGDIKQQKNNLITYKTLFAFSTLANTTHQTSIPISWTTLQTSDTNMFIVRGKYYVNSSDAAYGYRRFEMFITPMNDIVNNKPNRVSDLEIASFNSVTVTNLTHTIARLSSTSVNLILSFENTVPASFEHSLELEISYKEAIGTLSVGSPA